MTFFFVESTFLCNDLPLAYYVCLGCSLLRWETVVSSLNDPDLLWDLYNIKSNVTFGSLRECKKINNWVWENAI